MHLNRPNVLNSIRIISILSLQIVNSNHTLLNGVFSIAEYVPAALEAYTVTNVTLVVADGSVYFSLLYWDKRMDELIASFFFPYLLKQIHCEHLRAPCSKLQYP
jgi:hypothetical protein